MYRPSCTVYVPNQQIHNIYKQSFIYCKYSYVFQCIPEDDADALKHVEVLMIYMNIVNIYIYICEGHLESKERFAIQRYLLIIGKKKNMQVL